MGMRAWTLGVVSMATIGSGLSISGASAEAEAVRIDPFAAPAAIADSTSSSGAEAEIAPQQKRRRSPTQAMTRRQREDVDIATRKGLEFLARTQSANGAWPAHVGFKVNASYRVTDHDASHVGITALAVMAFLARGEVPGRGKYGKQLNRAIDYLIGCTEENGYLTSNGTRMYSHAFATLALAEVYGMTPRKDVRNALQRSVNLIADSQNKEGGWRYKPFAQESDMSITVCQVMALRAARNSGIFVARNVISDAVKYVRASARHPREQEYWRHIRNRRLGLFNTGVFKYQQRRDARASFALTAAGVTTLYGAGIYEDPLIERGLDFMVSKLEEYNHAFEDHYFFYYGNYYAVQAFYIAGGHRWNRYWHSTRKFLLDTQKSDGSWDCSIGPGKNFATAVATLILAIPYQYLPIFQR